jgi:predicted TIM-barrel fold metal-dependent hydrolase
MIIDAHAHIVDSLSGRTASGMTHSLRHGKIRWGSAEFQFTPPCAGPTAFTPEMLLAHMDWAGVARAVLLQGSFYGDKNDYVAEAVRRWPDRLVGAAYLDPRDPVARTSFRRCVEDYGFRIVKLELSVATGFTGLYPDLRVDGEELAWVWEEAEARGLVVTLDLGAVASASYQTGAVRTMVERHPSLSVVIAHLAQPPISRGDDAELDRLWQEQVLLAGAANVSLDLSSLPAYASAIEQYPFPSAQHYVGRAAELVGAEKLLWGTDAPGTLTSATYPQLLDFVWTHCEFLTDSERELVIGGNAQRIYFAGL